MEPVRAIRFVPVFRFQHAHVIQFAHATAFAVPIHAHVTLLPDARDILVPASLMEEHVVVIVHTGFTGGKIFRYFKKFYFFQFPQNQKQ